MLKVTSSFDTPNWTFIPYRIGTRSITSTATMWKHVPITALATTWAFSFGVDYGWMQKMYLMDWKMREVNISDHDVDPFCNHLFVALWPHARQASLKEYGRLAPVNYPLCCSYWWPMRRAATRLMPISD